MYLGLLHLPAILQGCWGSSIPGDATHFNPVASFAAIGEQAGKGFQLQELDARGVRMDGTLDLTEKTFDPTVFYRFQREAEPPAHQPPIGAGGSSAAVWRERVTLIVERQGFHETMSTPSETSYRHSSGVRRWDEVIEPQSPDPTLPAPTCAFAALWKIAGARGAPAGAVAEIQYTHEGYSFSIDGTDVRLSFGQDCQPR